MVLEQRLLGSPALHTPHLHGLFGKEERHLRHPVATSADVDPPRRSYRLWVRISINLRDAMADGVSWGLSDFIGPNRGFSRITGRKVRHSIVLRGM